MYIRPPDWWPEPIPEGHIFLLFKSIYGAKQAAPRGGFPRELEKAPQKQGSRSPWDSFHFANDASCRLLRGLSWAAGQAGSGRTSAVTRQAAENGMGPRLGGKERGCAGGGLVSPRRPTAEQKSRRHARDKTRGVVTRSFVGDRRRPPPGRGTARVRSHPLRSGGGGLPVRRGAPPAASARRGAPSRLPPPSPFVGAHRDRESPRAHRYGGGSVTRILASDGSRCLRSSP